MIAKPATIQPTQVNAVPFPMRCPRCRYGIMMNALHRNEHTCIICGNTEYTSVEPVKALGDTYFLRLRYKGEWRGLADTVVTMRAGESRNSGRLVMVPICPWCGDDMEERSLSGKRRDGTQMRYACGKYDHRISTFEVPGTDGELRWS